MNVRPCWLCGHLNSPEEAANEDGRYFCVRCCIELDHFMPLRVPLTGPSFLWARPADTTPTRIIKAANTWAEDEASR